MRVGLVCPYSLDIPGGVQNHVRGLAETLLDLGHDVSVLAPSESDDLPAYVVPAVVGTASQVSDCQELIFTRAPDGTLVGLAQLIVVCESGPPVMSTLVRAEGILSMGHQLAGNLALPP